MFVFAMSFKLKRYPKAFKAPSIQKMRICMYDAQLILNCLFKLFAYITFNSTI